MQSGGVGVVAMDAGNAILSVVMGAVVFGLDESEIAELTLRANSLIGILGVHFTVIDLLGQFGICELGGDIGKGVDEGRLGLSKGNRIWENSEEVSRD